jgi:hypothetical protein
MGIDLRGEDRILLPAGNANCCSDPVRGLAPNATAPLGIAAL